MENYDYSTIIIHNSMIIIRPTSSPFKVWHDYGNHKHYLWYGIHHFKKQ